MTRTIFVTCLCVAALAGCTRTVVREQVVEKQPVIQRETVVERPAIVATTPPASCMIGTMAYSTGSTSCQAGYQHRCNNGVWERIPGSYC